MLDMFLPPLFQCKWELRIKQRLVSIAIDALNTNAFEAGAFHDEYMKRWDVQVHKLLIKLRYIPVLEP